MSNSTSERDQARGDQADRHSDRHSGRRSQDIRRATVKAPTAPSALAEDRVFGRRAGFIGFSILAHLALLAGIMMNSNLVPALREIGGGDGQLQGAGSEAAGNNTEISIVEVSDAGTPLSPPSNAGVMTDTSSEIALPKEASTSKPAEKPAEKPVEKSVEKPAEKPAEKPVEKVAKTPEPKKLAPVVAAEIPAAPPETSEQVDQEVDQQEVSPQETPPTLLATPPVDSGSEQAAPISEPETAAEPETELATAAALAPESAPAPQAMPETAPETTPETAAEPGPEAATEAAPVAAASTLPPQEAEGDGDGGRGGSASQSEPATGIGESGSGPGAGLVINGPIRDAGELRALPGNPNPVYPARDRLKRKEGTAVILGQIQPDGRVGRVVLEKSSGSKEMDLESAKAFKSWRFQAGQAGWVRKPFQFRLVGNAKEVPAPLGEVLKRQSGALGK